MKMSLVSSGGGGGGILFPFIGWHFWCDSRFIVDSYHVEYYGYSLQDWSAQLDRSWNCLSGDIGMWYLLCWILCSPF